MTSRFAAARRDRRKSGAPVLSGEPDSMVPEFGEVGAAPLDVAATASPATGTHSIFVLGIGYHSGLVVNARDVPETAFTADLLVRQVRPLSVVSPAAGRQAP